MEKNEKYGVYSISKCAKNRENKILWLRLGSGHPNSDGSFSLCLGVLPLPDPKTGFINLYMRKLLPRNRQTRGNEASVNVETDPVFGLPLEAR